MNKVSVIIPVYNAQNFLENGIESIVNQDYKKIELLLIDDGSTDESWKIIEKYQKLYPEIIRGHHKDNTGVGDTRNFGIKKSTGDYITFVDADDYLDRDFVRKMIDNIEDNDIIISGYKQVDEKHNLIFERKIKNKEECKFRQMVIWAKCYKKDFLIKENIKFNSLKVGEDITFSLETYIKTDKIKCIDYCGYNNVSNDSSVTKNMSIKKDIDITKLIRDLCNLAQNSNFIKNNKKQLEFFYLKLFTNYLYDKSRVLDYEKLEKYYSENLLFLKDYYKKNKMKFGLSYNKFEPLSINAAVNIVILSYKLHLEKPLLKLFIKKFSGV